MRKNKQKKLIIALISVQVIKINNNDTGLNKKDGTLNINP